MKNYIDWFIFRTTEKDVERKSRDRHGFSDKYEYEQQDSQKVNYYYYYFIKYKSLIIIK